MNYREQNIARFTASRAAALLLGLMAVAMIWLSWAAGTDVMTLAANRGFALPSPNLWLFGKPLWQLAANLALLVACAGTMVVINSGYNILRSHSLTFIGLFLLMTASQPSVAVRFGGGMMLALTVLVAMMLFYSVYNAPRRGSRRVFLALALLSAGALTQYAYAVFIPVFVMGIGQMHILKFRTLAAAMLGIVTPLWLWWAFSPGFPELHVPELDNPFATFTVLDRVRFFSNLGVTMLAALIMGTLNLTKIFSYNAKARGLNGLLTVVGVMTGLAALVDWTNVTFYLPLLYACTAFQTGHFFHINAARRPGYLAVAILAAAYVGLWVWSFF